MFNKKRAAFRRRTALDIKSVYKDMEKFITFDELRDIVSELADNFMENKRYDVTISLSHCTSSDELTVSVKDREAFHKAVSIESYQIIERPKDAIDISRIIKMAIKQYEAEITNADNETESPIES